jgi:hypothetical protein
MVLDAVVRIYEGEWFSEGRVIEIADDFVLVDFSDWKQRYAKSELKVEHIFYQTIWIATRESGQTIEDFRH